MFAALELLVIDMAELYFLIRSEGIYESESTLIPSVDKESISRSPILLALTAYASEYSCSRQPFQLSVCKKVARRSG